MLFVELRQIRYFLEVAKREHFTEASEKLHVAQSAVSRQINQLEEELGVSLFVREGRRVHITPIGRLFADKMTQALQLIDHATQEVTEYIHPERGMIKIAYPISLAAHTLPRAIQSFRQIYQQIDFQLKQQLYYDLIDSVIKGEFNMALISPLPLQEERVVKEALFEDSIVALLPIAHPLSKKEEISLNQLKDDFFCVLPEGFVFREMVVHACTEAGFEPLIGFEGDDIDALKGLVSAGLGIALMPQVTLLENIPSSTVKIRISNPQLTRTVGMIRAKDRDLLPAEQLFYQFIKSFYKESEEKL